MKDAGHRGKHKDFSGAKFTDDLDPEQLWDRTIHRMEIFEMWWMIFSFVLFINIGIAFLVAWAGEGK